MDTVIVVPVDATAMSQQPFYVQSAETPYPSALFLHRNQVQDPIHNCELAMRDLSYAIRSKPEWWKKYKDPVIRQKWATEALKAPITRIAPLQPEHVQYCLDELEEYDLARDEAATTQPSVVRGSWESESLLSEDVHNKLLEEVNKLKQIPEEEKDWHPGSDGQVLDLVHPSMYCLRYGKTQSTFGAVQAPIERSADGFFTLSERAFDNGQEKVNGRSEATAWLPTDFVVSANGRKAGALGYINNVHPETQGGLHNALCDTLSQFLPLFEKTLGDLRTDFSHRIIAGQSTIDESTKPINPTTSEPCEPWDDDCEDDIDSEAETDEDSEAEEFPATAKVSVWKTWMRTQPYNDPLPPAYCLPKPEERLGQGPSLAGAKIQVIVKIAEILLTPEKPTYPGGGWHVEGMLNESIVATGLYYLSSENITTSKLSFRVALDSEGPQDYEQEDPCKLLWRSYGLRRDSPLNAHLGSFHAQEKRGIVFPNLYQHRVEPFQLADPTKPGRRTVVAFFLCDPTYRIPSTSDIPPQRLDWLQHLLASSSQTPSALLKLPQEIKDRITQMLEDDETIMSRSTAETVRASLMTERSAVKQAQDEAIFEYGFSLCEH